MGDFLSSHFPTKFNKADNIYITPDFKSITSTSFQTELFTCSLRALQECCLCISWRCPTLLLLCRDRVICATVPHTRLICISFLWFVWFEFIFHIWYNYLENNGFSLFIPFPLAAGGSQHSSLLDTHQQLQTKCCKEPFWNSVVVFKPGLLLDIAIGWILCHFL